MNIGYYYTKQKPHQLLILALFYPNCHVEIWDSLPDVMSAQLSTTKLFETLEKL